MSPAKLGTTVAILATAAGFAAFAGSAEAQISGSIGGDVVDHGPVKVPGDPSGRLPHGSGAFQWGLGLTDPLLGAGLG